MGRGKRIKKSSNRQVTDSKRRNGIMKKAREMNALCDAQVSVVISDDSGKKHELWSPSTTFVDMLDQYHELSGKRLWDTKDEQLDKEINRIKKENDSMQIEFRHLKEEDITSLNYKELMVLEDALENGISALKAKQSQLHLNPMDEHVIESQEVYDYHQQTRPRL